jgi:hypothetical protein
MRKEQEKQAQARAAFWLCTAVRQTSFFYFCFESHCKVNAYTAFPAYRLV